jgi:hypothetical protein
MPVLAWALASACASMPPPVERADTQNVHSFAVQHRHELERELGDGGGPHVRTLVSRAKCRSIINAARLLTEQQSSIYPAPSDEVAADRLVAVLAGNEELGCSAVNGTAAGKPTGPQPRAEARAKNAADRANMKEQYGE